MIQRDFYECSTLADAQDLISHILATTDGLDSSVGWSNIIQYDDGNNIVYYVKLNRAHKTDIKTYSLPSGNTILTVKLNTRSGNEEGSGTSFTHYPAFDERVGLYKTDTDEDGTSDALDAFPNDSTETTDSDKDGVGDNADVFPNDPTETADADEDGIGDNSDAFPNDPLNGTGSDPDPTDPDPTDPKDPKGG